MIGQRVVREESPATATRLTVLADLFERLHAEQIRYCHWKSTEHLGASLQGITDLDVLVDRRDARCLARVLTEGGFHLFRDPGRAYPGVEDYLGFDEETGRLTHLHLHYQLILGEKFLKGYRLPWEGAALATRRWDADHRLYVIDPPLEALLLVTRAALKLRARDYLLAAAGVPYFRGGMLRELRWLARRIDADQLRAHASALVGAPAAALLGELVTAPVPSIRQLAAFRRSIRPRLADYRMYDALGARRRRWVREAAWLWVALRNRSRGLAKRSTRTAPQGGLAIAVVGPPAGTALAWELLTWLAPHMAVVPDVAARRSRDARRARQRGLVVVTDRLVSATAVDRPDLLIDLGSPDGSRRLEQPGEIVTIELDAGAAPALLLLQAKRAIWETLCGRR